ncbi:FAD-dependent monooxygenase [Streptomyces abikoensis]|uniref:FAD-dependent monooxygenase n=1 Tax=Streptomyces abikoensis TaxID=97398 RepID=UPI00368890A4
MRTCSSPSATGRATAIARRRVAETLRDGRVFLAGDAGHIFSAAGAAERRY